MHSENTIEKYGLSSITVLGIGYVNLGKNFSIGHNCSISVLNDCLEVENATLED